MLTQVTPHSLFSLEPQRFSKDGYEEHLQVNHLAPALLSLLLLPSLIRGSPSRIINVNSIVCSIFANIIPSHTHSSYDVQNTLVHTDIGFILDAFCGLC